jgi:hypothetical protein
MYVHRNRIGSEKTNPPANEKTSTAQTPSKFLGLGDSIAYLTLKSLACFLPPLLKTVRTVYFNQARRSPNVKPLGMGLFAGYFGGAGGPPVGAGAALD